METHHEVHLSVEERSRSVYATATTNTFFAFSLLRLSPPLSSFLRHRSSSDLFSYSHLFSPSPSSSPAVTVPETQVFLLAKKFEALHLLFLKIAMIALHTRN